MGVTAEQDAVRGEAEDLFGSLGGAHVDRLVERPEMIKGQGVCETDPVPDDSHREVFEKGGEVIETALVFRGLAAKQVLQHEIVVPLYHEHSMLAKKADRILQQVQPEGIADISEVYEGFRPPFLENAYGRGEGLQPVVAVRHEADSLWEGASCIPRCALSRY